MELTTVTEGSTRRAPFKRPSEGLLQRISSVKPDFNAQEVKPGPADSLAMSCTLLYYLCKGPSSNLKTGRFIRVLTHDGLDCRKRSSLLGITRLSGSCCCIALVLCALAAGCSFLPNGL